MPIPRARERASIAQLTIDLIKIIHDGKFGKLTTPNISGEVETLLISGAVLIGHVKGKPKTATDISRFLGIPRATVLRKLDRLEQDGMITRKGRKYITLVPDETDFSYVDRALALIRKVATI